MGQVTISLPDEIDRQLRQYTVARGYSTVSSLVAEALREKFDTTKRLEYWTRVSLVVQLENQRLLDALIQGGSPLKQGDWSRDVVLDALTYGYQREYSAGFQYVDQDEMSPSDGKYVIDVLDMYADLQFSANEIGEKQLSKQMLFPGFDGNHQGQYMAFAQYLRSNRRFAHVVCSSEDVNSHGMGPDYRAMLTRYRLVRSIEKDRVQPLSKGAILKVLARKAREND
jgi:uncharacterized protein YfbU (UPF0304 family)